MGTNEDERTPGGDAGADDAAEPGEQTYEKQSRFIGVGIALGVSIGTALSVALDSWAFLGVGIAIGVAFGVAMGQWKSEPDANENSADQESDDPRS